METSMRDNGGIMKKALLFFLFALFIVSSCKNSGENSENSAYQTDEKAALPVNTQETPKRAVVLVRGNNWVSGIPGLGTNVFSALNGDYRLEGAEGIFSVYLTGARLYFSDEWQQSAAGNIQFYQHTAEEGLIVMAVLEDSSSVIWTVIFLFPGGLEECGLDARTFNLMCGAWTSRLLYYISQANTTSEISLPAVVEF